MARYYSNFEELNEKSMIEEPDDELWTLSLPELVEAGIYEEKDEPEAPENYDPEHAQRILDRFLTKFEKGPGNQVENTESPSVDPVDEQSEDQPEEHSYDSECVYNGQIMVRDHQPLMLANLESFSSWSAGVHFQMTLDDGFSRALIRDGDFRLIDTDIHPVEGDYRFEGRYHRVVCRGKYGLIDRRARLAVDPVFESLTRMIEGRAFGLLEGEAFVISENLEWSTVPGGPYANFNSFDGKSVVVARETPEGLRWGLISMEGEVLMPDEHQFLRRVSDRHFISKRGEYFGVINLEGREVQPFIYIACHPPAEQFVPLLANTGYYSLLNGETGKIVESIEIDGELLPLKITAVHAEFRVVTALQVEKEKKYLNTAAPHPESRILAG